MFISARIQAPVGLMNQSYDPSVVAALQAQGIDPFAEMNIGIWTFFLCFSSSLFNQISSRLISFDRSFDNIKYGHF